MTMFDDDDEDDFFQMEMEGNGNNKDPDLDLDRTTQKMDKFLEEEEEEDEQHQREEQREKFKMKKEKEMMMKKKRSIFDLEMEEDEEDPKREEREGISKGRGIWDEEGQTHWDQINGDEQQKGSMRRKMKDKSNKRMRETDQLERRSTFVDSVRSGSSSMPSSSSSPSPSGSPFPFQPSPVRRPIPGPAGKINSQRTNEKGGKRSTKEQWKGDLVNNFWSCPSFPGKLSA